MAVKIGILGTEHGHVMSYGAVWANDPSLGIEIAGVWDHDEALMEKNAAALKSKPMSFDDILADSSIEGVVISGETSYHCAHTIAAAKAGKKIICYKPMAMNMAEADAMAEAVKQYNVPFTLGYQSRVDSQNIEIRRIIQSGELGKVFQYRRRHGLATHKWGNFENAWHNQPELNRDIFADDSAHPIDMLNWIFGVPESVMCEITTACNPKVPNDTGVALFRYPDGMIAEISCCFATVASEITTEVYMENGAINQYLGDAVSCNVAHPEDTLGLRVYRSEDGKWTPAEIPTPASHGLRIREQAYPFAAFLKGERGPVCSIDEARNSLRMVMACYVSAKEGRRVYLDDPAIAHFN